MWLIAGIPFIFLVVWHAYSFCWGLDCQPIRYNSVNLHTYKTLSSSTFLQVSTLVYTAKKIVEDPGWVSFPVCWAPWVSCILLCSTPGRFFWIDVCLPDRSATGQWRVCCLWRDSWSRNHPFWSGLAALHRNAHCTTKSLQSLQSLHLLWFALNDVQWCVLLEGHQKIVGHSHA